MSRGDRIRWRDTILKTTASYTQVLKHGTWVKGHGFHLYYLPADDVRAGFAVSRKIRTHVQRNRVRRRLRELYRLNLAKFPPGWYIFMGTPKTLERSFSDLQKELDRMLRALASSGSSPA